MTLEKILWGENGFHCDICSDGGKLHDKFTERLEEADQILHNDIPNEVSWTSGGLSSGRLEYHFEELSLNIFFNRYGDPMVTHKVENKTLSRKWIDGLRVQLRETWDPLSIQISSVSELCILVMNMVEHTTIFLDEYRFPDPEEKIRLLQHKEELVSLVDAENVRDVISHLTDSKPKAFLDRIISSIEQQSSYRCGVGRVVHCEVIARSDLTNRFINAQQKLKGKLQGLSVENLRQSIPGDVRHSFGNSTRSKEDMIEYLCKPRLTYHGTQASSVPSIVRYGFLKPGSINPKTGVSVPIRCGSTYGQGIYTSPDPIFSLNYVTPENDRNSNPRTILGAKLIVCLTLMGRSVQVTRDDEWHFQDEPMLNADSHVGNNQLEYIVFDSARVLPCYVVHLDWGSKRTQEMVAYSLEREMRLRAMQRRADLRMWKFTGNDTPGDKKRQKEEKLAQARKFFAYGYGPVAGNKIIIEDIADTDDDEEDYGEYQLQRIDAKVLEKSVWDWDYELAGKTEKDQYSDERYQKVKKIPIA